MSEKDLADLAFQGIHSYLRENLEDHIYLSLKQLQQFALVQENQIKNSKEIGRPSHREVHVVEHSLDSSDGESSEVLNADFVWPSKTKSLTCDVLKPIHKKRQDDITRLMWLSVIRFLMNCIRVATSSFLTLYHRLRN
jgi:hypothetical protein